MGTLASEFGPHVRRGHETRPSIVPPPVGRKPLIDVDWSSPRQRRPRGRRC